MRVLVVRLSSMGDLVHTLPSLTDAIEADPTIRFDWAVDQTFSDIPSWHKGVERVIPFPPRRGGRNLLKSLLSGKISAFIQQVRQTNYDRIIDLQGDFKGALTACMARGTRCGYDARSAREWGAHFGYQQDFFVARGQHSITRMRQLMAQALSYPYRDGNPCYGIDRSRLPAVSLPVSAPYLVFIHSTSWESKCWPEACWKQLTQRALDAGFSVVLPWGNMKEQARAQRIANHRDRVFILPHFSISQKASVIANATATVGCDTGLSHIAAAINIPSVSLYGATDPVLVGAIGGNQKQVVSRFECVKCHQTKCTYTKATLSKPACLVEITPEKVWSELERLLA